MNYLGAPPIEAAALTARVVHPREIDAGLVSQWQVLRGKRNCYASAFYAPEFTLAVGGAREDARVAICEAYGEVVGFLPFHLVRQRIAKPIGGHINDYHGAILGGRLDQSNPQLLRAVRIDAYDFNHLPVALGTRVEMARANGSSPQMVLSDGYDAYLDQRPSSFRRGYSAMKRKLRKLEREVGKVSFEFASSDPVHFHAHAWMRTALYRKLGKDSRFGEGWEGEVLDRLRDTHGPSFRTVLNVLKAGDKVVAAQFGLISNGVMHWWFPAYAETAARYSPGVALIDFCAREARDHGIVAIDFGRGDERYKRFFANQETPLLAGSTVRRGASSSTARRIVNGVVGQFEQALPEHLRGYPQRIADRLVTGVAIPRYG